VEATVVTDEVLARFLFGGREVRYTSSRAPTEAIDNPGALVRRVVDDTGLRQGFRIRGR
jgi:hypothetical protein